ncbi:IclR family transcriptional regulator [Natrialba asiatica]|uniref:IclR family transcriptional regulator n=1 Tax=Natrialba asiatica (strain ATCC 700177 / DSM 12278 / JCM 9576 / FERM P-10747 / NBRC 102637 / 172P1) TaxID=29540 RepID=M0B695_NATA1|nr:IclR family transcriptional regulator [Natrialba asiatica]ELZ05793.1 IclR family transcriptional regulator [Natrialba asiatica DSM 12278]
MANEQQYPVQAAGTTFRIIETLHRLNGAGVSELADELTMPKSTVHDHLQTLTEAEYLVNQNGTYHIGVRFLELGGFARSQMKFYQIASPEMQKLAEKTGEHANLLIEEHGKGVFLNKAKGSEAVTLDTHIGKRVHLHTTAMGKAILANYPESKVDKIIDQHGLPSVTEKTITDAAVLKAQLSEIRERGYAIDDEERVSGMRCVAAPICPTDGTPLGAISVSGPTNRFEGETLTTEIPKNVLSTANVIEVNMTYS